MRYYSLALLAATTAVMAHMDHDDVLFERHARKVLEARQGPAYPNGPGFTVPAFTAITAISDGATATQPTVALPTAAVPGQTPFPGAPPLPVINIVPAQWPTLYRTPPIDSDQVKAWLKELDGHTIPSFAPTRNASCELDAAAAAEAGPNARCWWTCGGCTRATDITTCKDKGDWGLTFDDGPAFYTPKLLHYLDSVQLKATFYLVGSNVIARPEMVQAEIMDGHELSIHTWSHTALTTLTNEQVVAELGWTREAIKQVTGVTPLTMRPPYGDIDDRVRAISLAMGLVPVMWTRLEPNGVEVLFDSNDWRVHGGTVNSTQAKAQLDAALALAPGLDTGVIVLQHDLYQESVDLAIGYTQPENIGKFKMQPVNTCQKQPVGNAYAETNKNPNNPAVSGKPTTTGTGASSTGTGKAGQSTGAATSVSATGSLMGLALTGAALFGAALTL